MQFCNLIPVLETPTGNSSTGDEFQQLKELLKQRVQPSEKGKGKEIGNHYYNLEKKVH